MVANNHALVLFLKAAVARALAACLLVLAIAATAEAAVSRRVALVIGNGAYKSAPVLDNPTIDAHAMAAALKRLGFDVIEGYDLPGTEMREKLGEFSTSLREAKVALVYYAGHGVSVDDENYLLPTDLVLRSAADLEIHGLSVTSIMRQMKREERANVVILDACRDNPFAKQLAATDKRRGVDSDRGLSPIEGGIAKGSLIAFATDPKQTALDGATGENSPFTRALLKNLETPGITIDAMMSRVREEVWAETAHKQMPWVNTSLVGGDLYLNPVAAPVQAAALEPAAVPAALAPDRLTMENKLWDSAEKSNAADDYQVYLDAYPNGVYSKMAKNRISRLTGGTLATGAASVPAAGPSPAIVPQPSTILASAGGDGKLSPESAVSKAALKMDIATPATEKLLRLTDALRREIKQRLKVMGFNTGADTAKFDDTTRAAIGEWQKSNEIQATASLSKLQLAALDEQSEAQYQRFLTAQPMVQPSRSLVKAKPKKIAPGIQQARQQRGGGGGGGSPPPAGGAGFGGAGNMGEFFGGVARGVMRIR